LAAIDIVECFTHNKNRTIENELRKDWRMYYNAWWGTRKMSDLITSKEYLDMSVNHQEQVTFDEALDIADTARKRLRKKRHGN